MCPQGLSIDSRLDAIDGLMEQLCRLASPTLPGDRLIAMEIVLVEALTNIILHGESGPQAKIDLLVSTGADAVTIEIRDDGRPVPEGLFQAARDPAEIDPLAENGRGIALIASLSDRLDYHSDAEGNRLILTFLTEEVA
ncbi:ATP-binding protein [Paracoccus sp. (in: a-proteobacteria)]|uniref:ATP-binding protein n=1 Tax=Paracoccus sp. TaxID=267 RepID=UPI00396C4F47